ncbi:methyltransferase domain-containing protein [Halovulum dunhuangense]|uniref:Methyltransferase domain-containing protein n=1 Tax=Halovulum dunhuangense TaxID=1505036 RepID=A0A849KV41_9RHOB|nr:methyltransferase domain-containing protein [Halovulum dunhuangense]NNU79511.1 methyltransferase domain-containing protein [Halovulum dunhuangense]
MHLDVVDLRAFYYRTKLGRIAQRALQQSLRKLWPDTAHMTVAGFGFAVPFLRPFTSDARRVISLMPAQQGVMAWPQGLPNHSVLVEETAWPVATGTVDRLIVAHGLETCDRANALLEEIHRVLAPGGHVVFIVPNRSGMWARRDATPFGFGRPYSFGQVETLLRAHAFLPERHAAALYTPPSHKRFWLRTDQVWEGLGRRLDAQVLAGALLVEASKQVYATPRRGKSIMVPGPLDVLEGLTYPAPKPASGRAALSEPR